MKNLTAVISAFLLTAAPVWAAEESHGEHAEHVEHAGEHASGGLPQFDPSSFPSQVFWLVVFFSFLYIFFSRKTLPDISSVLENRHELVQSDLETAEQLKQEAEEVQHSYEESLEKARQEAATCFYDIEEGIKEKTTQAYDAFYEKASKDIAKAEERIEEAKAQAMEDMNALAAEIASEAAEKIVGISTDLKQVKTVVEALHNSRAKAA